MDETEVGISILLKLLHPLKQPPERLVIEEGMLILVRLEQLSKHELPK